MGEKRWVLLIASEVGGTDSVSDRAMERLVDAIGEEGYQLVRTTSPEDGLSLVTSDPSYSAVLLDWDLEGKSQFEERAALDVYGADRIAEEHDRENEPRRRRSDRLLGDTADVVGCAGQVTQYNRGGSPVGDERKHHATDDDDLRRPDDTVSPVA